MVRNAAVEAEKKIRTIKSSVQPADRSRSPRTFMGMLGGKPSTQIDVLGSIFQSDKKQLYGIGINGGICVSFRRSVL